MRHTEYVEHKGFILHIRSLFTQMGGSQLSLSLKRHSMMFLSPCHIPRLKWLHKGFISISSKQVFSSHRTISCTMGICKIFSSLMWDILCCWSWTETQLFINIRRKCEWPSSLVRAHCPLRDEAASGLSKNRGHFLQKVNKNIPSVLGYKLHFQLWLIC